MPVAASHDGQRNAWLQWGPLGLACAAAIAGEPLLPRWGFMWALALAVVVGFKWATAYAHRPVHPAWLWGWPGMDPVRFHTAPRRRAKPGELVGPLLQVALGSILLWGLVPRLGGGLPAAWVGLVALGLMLHFGFVRLLAYLWRRRGFDARPLFDRPLASRSLGEFWGRRWNRGFADVAARWVFRPLAGRVGPRRAMLAVFLASGLGHELLLSVPAGGGYGLCTLYFLLQAAGLTFERGRRSRGFTVLVVVAPLPLLFHPVFLRVVILPFLAALGA